MSESERKLRILHTEASVGWGGQEIRILTEAQTFIAHGHDVMVAANRLFRWPGSCLVLGRSEAIHEGIPRSRAAHSSAA